jgi:hypothetical protein
MRRLVSHVAVAMIAGAALLAGCATPAEKGAMAVDKQMVVAKKQPYAVAVSVTGGAETGAMSSSNIANVDLKSAIEASIRETQVFREVVDVNGAQYELLVNVITLSKPSFGFSMTVDLEAGWTLTRVADRKVVLRKSVSSTYTAPASAAFAGTVRLRLAVEGAAKANIAQGLAAIGMLDL